MCQHLFDEICTSSTQRSGIRDFQLCFNKNLHLAAMAEDSPPSTSAKTKSTSPVGVPPRRAFTIDEASQSQFRHRPSTSRFTSSDAPTPGIRRRSSNFSDYSLREARRSFQSSTDDLLLPKPSEAGKDNNDSSPWHSAPLAFALLPALGGMFFTNGSSIITDIMLLGLAAIFLNWSVRIPWQVHFIIDGCLSLTIGIKGIGTTRHNP